MRPTLISGSCKMLTCLQAIIDHRPPFTLKPSLTILLSYYHHVHKLKAPRSVHPGGIITVATDLNMDKLIGLKHPLFPQLLNPFFKSKISDQTYLSKPNDNNDCRFLREECSLIQSNKRSQRIWKNCSAGCV